MMKYCAITLALLLTVAPGMVFADEGVSSAAAAASGIAGQSTTTVQNNTTIQGAVAAKQVRVLIEGAHGVNVDETVDVTAMKVLTSDGKWIAMNEPTALGALIRGLNQAGMSQYSVKSTQYGDYVSSVDGQSEKTIDADTGWSFWVNGQAPVTSATETDLKDGDVVVWAFNDWEKTLYPHVALSASSIAVGGLLTVAVTADQTTYDANWNPTTKTIPVQGATVHFGDQTAVTDELGKATFVGKQHGKNNVWVEEQRADGLPLVIHSPSQQVVVGQNIADVHVRIEGYKGTLLDEAVEVGPETVADTAGNKIAMMEPTVLGAVKQAADDNHLPVTIQPSSYGPYLSAIGQEKAKDINNNTGWFAVVNGHTAQMSLDQIRVDDGDSIVLYFGDYTQTVWPTLKLSSSDAALGAVVSAVVTWESYDANGNLFTQPDQGATVHFGDQTAITDANGIAKLILSEPGNMVVTVGKTDPITGLPIVVNSDPQMIQVSHHRVVAFNDVSGDDEAAKAIQALANEGVIIGEGDGEFHPQASITRSQLAKLLTDALHLPLKAGYVSFNDVATESWSAPYIYAANAAGLMLGDDWQNFDPNAPVTREQLAVIVDRVAGHTDDALSISQAAVESNLPFADSAAIDDWAKPWMAVATEQPAFKAIMGHSALPHQSVARDEAALVVSMLAN